MSSAPAIATPRADVGLHEAAACIRQRILQTPVRTEPFPHLVVDELLPDAVRRGLDEYWPERARMGQTNCMFRGEARVSRLAAVSSGSERAFWEVLRSLTTAVNRAVRIRLAKYSVIKFYMMAGPGWQRRLETPVYEDDDALLAHYTGIVDLPVHIDHARLVMNAFVYLEDRDSRTPEPLRGTMLYRSLGFAWPTNAEIPRPLRERFLREEVEIGWRDNRLLAYVNGPTSFHGVPRHDLGEGRRRLLMCGSLLDQATTARIYDEALR
jgi:hypothetical protein